MTKPVVEGAPAAVRVVRVAGREERDPREPWEVPGTEQDLAELGTRRFERLPHRPMNRAEVPGLALDALSAAVGDLALNQLFVIPRVARMVGDERGKGGAGPAQWVMSPTEVLAVGAERLAVWLDDPAGPRIRAAMPIDDVVAVLDRTVLLHGRLEIVGRDASIVVRYNTVGRADVRELLRPIRAASSAHGAPVPDGVGRDPRSLPHKWMALVLSSDVQPFARGPVAVAAGDLATRRRVLHNGVAVLTPRELIVATDPTPDVRLAQFGVDLLAVGRARLLAIEGHGDTLTLTVDAWPGRVEVRVAAHPSLVDEAARLLAPFVGDSAAQSGSGR